MKPIESRHVKKMRREAKMLKKTTGVRHTAALDQVAIDYGYKHWGDVMRVENGVVEAARRMTAVCPVEVRP